MTKRFDLTLSFLQREPADAAATLEDLPPEDVAELLAIAPARIAAPAVAQMASWRAASVLERMPSDKAAGLVNNLPYDDALGAVRAMKNETREQLLESSGTRIADHIRRSLRYPEGTVGSLMDPSAPIFAGDVTVESARRYLSQDRGGAHHHVFVHGPDRQFIGAVAVGRLIHAHTQQCLADFAEGRDIALASSAALAAVAHDPAWDEYPMRPVVGRQQQLIGGLQRRILRHATTKPIQIRRGAGPASIAAHIFTMYVHTCQGMAAVLLQSGASAPRATGRSADNDR